MLAKFRNIQKIILYYPGFPGLPPVNPPGGGFQNKKVLCTVAKPVLAGVTEEKNSSEEFDFQWIYEGGNLVKRSESGYGLFLKKAFRVNNGFSNSVLNGNNKLISGGKIMKSIPEEHR